MTEPSHPFRLYLTSALLLTGLVACAPQQEPDTPEPEPTVAPASGTPSVTLSVATPTPPPEVVIAPTPTPRAKFDPKNPDWSLRYAMLKDHYVTQFKPQAQIGQNLTIPLASGGEQAGVIKAIYEDSIDLEFENGSMNLHAEAMREDAQMYFFQQYFAHHKAVKQARSEYAKWQQMVAEANRPKPTATPYRQVVQNPIIPRTRPAQGPDGLTRTYRPDPNAEPPKNDKPKGRVWQVDAYLRKNSAVPHSLRYQKWYKVQKHGSGYKVRVQYSVESAGGLGTSQEDMMFFMHADGKVYQRAAVK